MDKDEQTVDEKIKDLYGNLAHTEIDGFNSMRDRNIADMVIGKYFSKYPRYLKREIKENCVLELWAKRSQFRADMGAKYETWGFAVCRNAMLDQYAGQVNLGANCASFDFVVGVDDNGKSTTLLDLYADKVSTEINLDKIDKQITHEKVMSKDFENENKQKIIAMTLAGHPPREIMKVVNVCRQYIDKVKRQYKNALAEVSEIQNKSVG